MSRRPGRPSRRLALAGRDVVGSVVVVVVLLILYAIIHPAFISSNQVSTLFDESAAVALAAVGEAIIIITGGFDLSVGSAISLVNVLLVVHMRSSTGSELLWILVGLAVGAGMGLVNGLLVTLLRIPSIVATLASSFLYGGFALLVLKQPGGSVPSALGNWFTGGHGDVPNAFIVLVVVTVLWLIVKRTSLGTAIYALGGDPDAARAQGVADRPNLVGAYTLAGLFYGMAGIFLTAQTASGDPNVGAPLVLTVFAAVVLGGVSFSGGRGEPSSSILGAFILTLIGDVLYALGVSSFYTPIFNGIVLLIALLVSARGAQAIRWIRDRAAGAGTLGGPPVAAMTSRSDDRSVTIGGGT